MICDIFHAVIKNRYWEKKRNDKKRREIKQQLLMSKAGILLLRRCMINCILFSPRFWQLCCSKKKKLISGYHVKCTHAPNQILTLPWLLSDAWCDRVVFCLLFPWWTATTTAVLLTLKFDRLKLFQNIYEYNWAWYNILSKFSFEKFKQNLIGYLMWNYRWASFVVGKFCHQEIGLIHLKQTIFYRTF